MLKVSHNEGFFSCCSVILEKIIEYFNITCGEFPEKVCTKDSFGLYKPLKYETKDIMYEFFMPPSGGDEAQFSTPRPPVDYFHHYQYNNYKRFDYKNITPFIEKYFQPSEEIQNIIEFLEYTYGIDYKNTCVLFYRGNDKATETTLPTYRQMAERAIKIYNENPNIQFLIQSDETEFIEMMTLLFPDNSFYFKNEIRHIKRAREHQVDKTAAECIHCKKESNFKFIKIFLAITIIMSKCKYVVCSSGNCSMWIMFYRGNANDVFQYVKHSPEYTNGAWL